jgi:5S rRNA maturation endonuclease (ribonuclease M5)
VQKLLSEAAKPVLIVEGEKSVAAAEKLMPAAVVVTTAGGSNSPGKTDLSPLVGRQIIIWPDNDDSGAMFVDNMVEGLGEQDRSAVVLVMAVPQFAASTEGGVATLKPSPEKKKGWDAADAVNEGWTAEHMRLYLEKNPLWERAIEYSVPGFEVLDKGVKERKTNRDGDSFLVDAATRFDVLGHTKWSGTDEWGYLLTAVDPQRTEDFSDTRLSGSQQERFGHSPNGAGYRRLQQRLCLQVHLGGSAERNRYGS